MLHFATLFVDVYLLIIIDRRRKIVNEGKNFAEIWLFFLSAVMKLTDLSASDLRYYEDQELIKNLIENEGNRRTYSFE